MSAAMPSLGRFPRYAVIALWSVPVLVVGQFAMVAVLPVALVVFAAIRHSVAGTLRWWSLLLALSYATPLAIWILREDGARSLSRDMHPAFVLLIAAVSIVMLLVHHTRTRPRRLSGALQ